MNAADSTRLAGDAYCTRLAHSEVSMLDDKTRLAQEGYQSKLARDAAGGQSDASEFYKVGEKIGDRYEVLAIHHGAMGVVYGCFDHQTKLPRALKTVRARHAHDKQVLSLFESEAAVWISLEKHPYIVRAYLVESFKALPYVITEYVRGPEGMEGDLRGWLGHPRLTLQVAVAIALQIAQGMQHAVRKVPNLVHRDLKPGNILVNGDGKAMVTDFGLVSAADSNAGTPAYMSPEQWRGDKLDARSDIYAFGCILFEMFTAHRLFPALSEHDWKCAHLESTPAALTGLVPELPSEIDRFVRCCLEKNKEARPQSWDEIVTFFAEWYHRLTGKAVVLDFSSLALNAIEWLNAGYSLVVLNRLDGSLQAFDRALEIDQSFLHAWFYKGVVLSALKRYDDAILAYDRALVIDPKSDDVLMNKGNALRDLKRYEEAIQAYDGALDQAIAINPKHVDVLLNKGNMLYELKRYDEAIHVYDRALAIDPNNASALKNKSISLHDLNRDALKVFHHTSAVKSKPLRELKYYDGMTLVSKRTEQLDRQKLPKNEVVAPANKSENFYVGLITGNVGQYFLRLARKQSGRFYVGLIAAAIVITWFGGGFNGINHDSEIAEQLAKKSSYDLAGARKSGYTDQQIIRHLSSTQTADAAETKQGFVEHKWPLDTPAVQKLDPIGRAPNGQSWPAKSGYLRGYKKLNTGGLSSLTIDNTSNDSNVYLKLYALGQSPPVAARHVFIKAGDIFTFKGVRAGNYDVRYRDLRNAGISKSEEFELREIHEDGGTRYSKMTLTLYKIQNGNMKIHDITEAEF